MQVTLDLWGVKFVCIASVVYGGRSSVGRAPDCGSGCRGFDPRRSPHYFHYLFSRSDDFQNRLGCFSVHIPACHVFDIIVNHN